MSWPSRLLGPGSLTQQGKSILKCSSGTLLVPKSLACPCDANKLIACVQGVHLFHSVLYGNSIFVVVLNT